MLCNKTHFRTETENELFHDQGIFILKVPESDRNKVFSLKLNSSPETKGLDISALNLYVPESETGV